MISMHLLLVLNLVVVAPPKALNAEASEHNTVGMRFYDARQFGPAADEFYAAYQTMPDARRDRAGRALLFGSIRMTLLQLYEQTGEVGPLCRLQAFLQEHIDGLAAAYAGEPESSELRTARVRHEEVMRQIEGFGAGACEPAPVPAPVVVAAPAATRAAPAAAPAGPSIVNAPTSDKIPPRHLRIAGGVTFGIAAALLGVMTYGIVTESGQRARVVEIRDRAPDCPLTQAEVRELQESRENASFGRHIAVGTGIAAAVMTGLGTTLFVLARRADRARRWSAAPWGSPSGAGLMVRVRFGAR